VLVSQAWAACEELGDWGLVALPWLRGVDGAWLADAAHGAIVCVDNHVRAGGQGESVLAALAEAAPVAAARTHLVAVEGVPSCGANDEVLRAHGLDAASLATRVTELAVL
jgi:transketolase